MSRRAIRWLGAVAMGTMLTACGSLETDYSADGEAPAVEYNSNSNSNSKNNNNSRSNSSNSSNSSDNSNGKNNSTAVESDPPSSEALPQEPESIDMQPPEVDHQAEQSPDGRYRIETFGVNDAITAAGLYPAAEIRLIDIASDEVKWSTHGYYRQSFLWSPDSRYAAVYAESRTHGETFLVDVATMDVIQLPNTDAIAPYWEGEPMTENEYLRHDPYFRHVNWPDNDRIRIAFEWNGGGDDRYSGTYEYSVSKKELLAVKWE